METAVIWDAIPLIMTSLWWTMWLLFGRQCLQSHFQAWKLYFYLNLYQIWKWILEYPLQNRICFVLTQCVTHWGQDNMATFCRWYFQINFQVKRLDSFKLHLNLKNEFENSYCQMEATYYLPQFQVKTLLLSFCRWHFQINLLLKDCCIFFHNSLWNMMAILF